VDTIQTITLLALAVLPGLFLTNYVFQHDKVDAEPAGLLWSLVLLGALSAIPASLSEGLLESMLVGFVPPNTPLYYALMSFFVVAVSEEGCKFVMLRLRTWNHPAFDFRFDGIVYGVMVGVGFATLENILYVLGAGFSTGVARALLSVPGHVSWGVFMGYYYGRAKAYAIAGNEKESRRNLVLSLLIPIAWHGIYDTCAFISGPLFFVLIGVALVGDIMMVVLVRRESKLDAAFWRPIAQNGFYAYAVAPAGAYGQMPPAVAGRPANRPLRPMGQAPQQGRGPAAPGYAPRGQMPQASQMQARPQGPMGARPGMAPQAPATRSARPAPMAAGAPVAPYVAPVPAARYTAPVPTKPFSWPKFLVKYILIYLGVMAGLIATALIVNSGVGGGGIVYDFLVFLVGLMVIVAIPYLVILIFAGALRVRRQRNLA
jgi:RsiW-degrading membrane proteinase PrsW (M82 family)